MIGVDLVVGRAFLIRDSALVHQERAAEFYLTQVFLDVFKLIGG